MNINIFCFLVLTLFQFNNNSNFNDTIERKTNSVITFKYIDSLKIADLYFKNNEIEKAINLRKRIIKHIPISNNAYFKNLLYLGYYLRKNNKPLEAIYYFNKSLEFDINNIKTKSSILFQLAYTYTKINDNVKAKAYYKLTINLLNKHKIDNKTYLRSCLKIAHIYLNDNKKLASLNKSILYCKKANFIYNKLKLNDYKYKYKIYDYIATAHNQHINLNTKKAITYYKKALKIAKQNKDTLRITNCLEWMGSLYNTTNYNKSIYYLSKATKICSKNDTLNITEINFSYGLTHARFKNYKKSITYFKKALTYLLNYKIGDINDIDKKILIACSKKIFLIEYLSKLAETYLKYYTKKQDPDFLNKSITYFKLADDVIDLLKINSSEFKSKLYWRKLSATIYGKAIKACYLNNSIKDAFYFIEKNKALLLMEDIATQNYRLTLNISQNLLDKETNYKKKLITLAQIEITKKNKNTFLKKMTSLQRTLKMFQDSIYKNTNKLDLEPTIYTVKDVKKDLKQDEIFAAYHISKDDGYGIYTNNENGYVIFITNKKKYFFEITNLPVLEKKITQLIKLTKKPFKTKDDSHKFNELAYFIYNKLVPTKEIRALINNKKLTIAPDGYLSFLPFETLITNNHSKKPAYLIQTCTISYLYSYSFLKNSIFGNQTNTSFLGFAPITFKDTTLTTLTNSKKELQNLNRFYNGNLYNYTKATKKTFLEQLPKHNIIHLATHANAQDTITPWIAFNNEKITLPELYLKKNNASLVVLSGCNTTLGKQEVGEGVMSLARGFFYGGSQSVVSSLWSVDDKATPYIMNEFYKNLNKNKTKSEALRNAKLMYLKNHTLSERSPYYWASFVLLGNDNTILNTTFNWYLYLFGFILLIVIGFYFKHKST